MGADADASAERAASHRAWSRSATRPIPVEPTRPTHHRVVTVGAAGAVAMPDVSPLRISRQVLLVSGNHTVALGRFTPDRKWTSRDQASLTSDTTGLSDVMNV